MRKMDCLTVVFDSDSEHKDIAVLMVSRKEENGVHIIKTFEDKEAVKLYKTLIGE